MKKEKKTINAKLLARYILKEFQREGSYISNAKLQRLLYYVQAYHLITFDIPAFSERLEAWKFGPVQPGVYREYKIFGYEPIMLKINIDEEEEIPLNIIKSVAHVIEEKGDATAFALHENTTTEDPWMKARNGLDDTAHSSNEITKESIASYFKTVHLQELPPL